MVEPKYDKITDFYTRFVADLDDVQNARDRCLLDTIGDPKGLDVCDLAYGEGYVSRYLFDSGARVTGVDLSPILLDIARERATSRAITYVQDDAQVLGTIKDASLDPVVCHMALMDNPELRPTLGAIHRTLKAGGRFIFLILHACFEGPFSSRMSTNQMPTVTL